MPIPKTNAFSFSASDNELVWSLEVRVDIPMWPDWVEKRVLTVRPAPVAEVVEKKPGPPPPPPLDDRLVGQPPALQATTGGEMPVQEQTPTGPPVEVPSEATPPAVQQQPVSDTTAPDGALMEIIERLGSASRYGSQREQIVGEYAEESFPCSVEIDSIERTYSYPPEKRFRNGRTVTGVIRGSDCEVSLQLPEERNGEIDTLGAGGTVSADCTLLKWNNIHDRLEMRQA